MGLLGINRMHPCTSTRQFDWLQSGDTPDVGRLIRWCTNRLWQLRLFSAQKADFDGLIK